MLKHCTARRRNLFRKPNPNLKVTLFRPELQPFYVVKTTGVKPLAHYEDTDTHQYRQFTNHQKSVKFTRIQIVQANTLIGNYMFEEYDPERNERVPFDDILNKNKFLIFSEILNCISTYYNQKLYPPPLQHAKITPVQTRNHYKHILPSNIIGSLDKRITRSQTKSL